MIAVQSLLNKQAESLCLNSRGQHARVQPRNSTPRLPRPVRAPQKAQSPTGMPESQQLPSRLVKACQSWSSLVKGFLRKKIFFHTSSIQPLTINHPQKSNPLQPSPSQSNPLKDPSPRGDFFGFPAWCPLCLGVKNQAEIKPIRPKLNRFF